MKITDVRIHILKTENRLKAFASIVIDDAFAIHELRILDGREGLFVAMPSRLVHDDVYRDIAHPVTSEARFAIEQAVLEAYEAAIKQEN